MNNSAIILMVDSDDWFDTDIQDQRVVEFRHINNEINNTKKQQFDQGYLEGLDWADSDYMLLDGDLKL